jgi:hypothetical protein
MPAEPKNHFQPDFMGEAGPPYDLSEENEFYLRFCFRFCFRFCLRLFCENECELLEVHEAVETKANDSESDRFSARVECGDSNCPEFVA